MKMIYNGTPVKSLNVHHYEMDTNDCDMVASDLQAGKTAVARGKKITGTGKAFEFAAYGTLPTNFPIPIPNGINTLLINSKLLYTQMNFAMDECKGLDFTNMVIGSVYDVDNAVANNITVIANNGFLEFQTDIDTELEFFYGKDNYVT